MRVTYYAFAADILIITIPLAKGGSKRTTEAHNRCPLGDPSPRHPSRGQGSYLVLKVLVTSD